MVPVTRAAVDVVSECSGVSPGEESLGGVVIPWGAFEGTAVSVSLLAPLDISCPSLHCPEGPRGRLCLRQTPRTHS